MLSLLASITRLGFPPRPVLNVLSDILSRSIVVVYDDVKWVTMGKEGV